MRHDRQVDNQLADYLDSAIEIGIGNSLNMDKMDTYTSGKWGGMCCGL